MCEELYGKSTLLIISIVLLYPQLDHRSSKSKNSNKGGVRITHILETHRNEDYVIGSLELASRTGAKIWHADAQLDYQYGDAVEGGQEWKLGGFKLEALL